MGKREITISDNIEARINEEATRLGITPDEVIRHILGEKFGQYGGVIGALSPSFPTPSAPESTTRTFYKLMAIQGTAKCPVCTQQVTLLDIKTGECGKCGGRIDVD